MKGRISNELVAASCAAVLAVYAAGYWRTREEAGRIDVREQERRPVRVVESPAEAPAAVPEPVIAPAPATTPEPATVPALAVAPAAAPTTVSAPATSEAPDAEPPVVTAPPTPPPPVADASPVVEKKASAEPVQPTQPEPPPAVPTQAPAAPATVPPPSDTDVPALAAVTEPLSPLSPPAPEPTPEPTSPWRDGVYTGWGRSRHGDIKAQVVILDGRIAEASIVSCETRYPCDVISHIIPQPVALQGPDVDYVSRATESADAYYYALVEALEEAQTPVEEPAPTSP